MRRGEEQQSRVFHDLCALLYTVLRAPQLASPPCPSAATEVSAPPLTQRRAVGRKQVSPAGFASLLLGASLALMLCGSVTFVIGCILMPWVLGLVLVFYFVGIVSNLSGLGKAILCPGACSEEMPGQTFPKFPII